ncbi:MAG: 1-(5-phosphoribosyl)-5-[(5-phosphoribosylamino)methylideneamino] imidazole-4-carboxamide isomerase [Deltaproteobacteria bacterium]|nr:1-(5-phosphoribosyl)-5-[(5-phosphoribosylamino)methylideneamino] imidazole-4-carboxamide isomerase [Deltaproteobacteria bacterium]
MVIIPAVDIKNGKCVRLLQGRMEDETVFSDDPAAMAQKWAKLGAKLIHVVDLQTVQKLLEMGVSRVIIGTEALKNPEWVMQTSKRFPDQVVVGIDARNGRVAIEGWTETTHTQAVDLAKRFEDCSVAAINFTDIYRDGMQTGPNIEETRRLAEAISIPVVASGGVSTIEDIQNLLPLETVGVIGVITGKALYSGTLDFKQALSLVQSGAPRKKVEQGCQKIVESLHCAVRRQG